MSGQKVFGVVGWKNSGKTTLIEALVRELTARGLRVSTIKHAHHGFDVDQPGKDSYRHRAAGAREVLVASSRRWALLHEMPDGDEPELSELLTHLAPCDLILVEGFKRGSHAKIEVAWVKGNDGLIADHDPTVIAVATDDPALAGEHQRLPLNEVTAIADFVCFRCGLPSPIQLVNRPPPVPG